VVAAGGPATPKNPTGGFGRNRGQVYAARGHICIRQNGPDLDQPIPHIGSWCLRFMGLLRVERHTEMKIQPVQSPGGFPGEDCENGPSVTRREPDCSRSSVRKWSIGCHAHGFAWACKSAWRPKHAHAKPWAWHPPEFVQTFHLWLGQLYFNRNVSQVRRVGTRCLPTPKALRTTR
jgi:hypothetical protein